MISGIRHYHYSTRNLSITLEQSTWLARAHAERVQRLEDENKMLKSRLLALERRLLRE